MPRIPAVFAMRINPKDRCRARWRCPSFRTQGTISLGLHPDPPFPRNRFGMDNPFRAVSPICPVQSPGA